MNEPDYEQLYRLMTSRRGEELRRLEAFQDAFCALMDTFIETDCQVGDAVKRQEEQMALVAGDAGPLQDAQIDAFLWKLDQRLHLKRAAAARAAMQVLLLDGAYTHSMDTLYVKIAELVGGTKFAVERNLRSFRKGVKEMGTDFYRLNLAQHNTNNAQFYCNALRLLKQDIR